MSSSTPAFVAVAVAPATEAPAIIEQNIVTKNEQVALSPVVVPVEASEPFPVKDGVVFDAKKKKPLTGNADIRFSDGRVYQGHFKKGLMDGKGSLKFPNGDSYTGKMKKGDIHGKGTFLYQDGRSYRGSLVKGKKQGRGEFLYPDLTRYKGGFKNDLFEGRA